MKPNYQVLEFDMAIPRDSAPIVEVGVRYDSVTVHQFPGGNIGLRLGGNNPNIPLLRTERFGFYDSCEHPFFCDEGLFLTNPAGAGVLILIVSMGTSPAVQA